MILLIPGTDQLLSAWAPWQVSVSCLFTNLKDLLQGKTLFTVKVWSNRKMAGDGTWDYEENNIEEKEMEEQALDRIIYLKG